MEIYIVYVLNLYILGWLCFNNQQKKLSRVEKKMIFDSCSKFIST